MLISNNGEMEKADKNNAKMNTADLNNVDTIREKANSLNAKKIKNINNLVHSQSCDGWKDKKFCNDELKKHISILFVALFLLTLVGSAAVFCFITFTNKFNEGIVENLILKNGTKAFEWWQDSPIQPLVKIYIFNYTNIDDYLSGKDAKLKVQDVGPYVYKEFGLRVNLEFADENKITFNDNKSLIFMPELSNGNREEDLVIVPNIPLLAAIAKAQDLGPLKKFGFETILSTSTPPEFHKKTVDEYLFGYSDSFIRMTPDIHADKVGLLANRRGISVDSLTVFTGEDSLDNLGRIYAMNGKTQLDIWSTPECNEITGTDGSQFPPHLMDKEEELLIFIKSFCRPLRMKYDREVTVLNGIPAWRYKSPEGVFASSRTNPDNTCYCDADKDDWCPPDGVFDASKCVDGIPLLLSYPHFLEGDESLLEHFEGLKPNSVKHGSFADIHPRMAFPIGGASRLQMNFRVTSKEIPGFFKSYKWYTKFPKNFTLPLFWFEVTSGEIPPEFQKIVFHTTQTANATYLAIQYGSLVGAFVSLLLLLSTTFIYYVRLTRKPTEKIENRDVIVTYEADLYPNISSQMDQSGIE